VLRDRFDRLEDTLRMAHEMWSGDRGSGGRLEGKTVTAERLLNSPQALTRPRIPILIGGGGERKTLRLVAQYADACNIFGREPDFVRHKFAVIREHCEALGRPYEEIERTVLTGVDLSTESTAQLVDRFGALAEAGAQHIIFGVTNVDRVDQLDTLAQEVFPKLR
jgi:alkanesulfonate monooxygenase SsuD/methylene tetrahydromethanopterin reductase-like flavin-dependent oxidoreductase (luciferase family)